VGGAEWRYVYDPENRLKEAWRGAERVARFRYDAEVNRTVREVGGLRTVVVDEGYEVRGGGVRKVYRLGGETVAVREGSTVDAAVGDHLGSVTVLAQGGSPAGVTRYLPYGAIRLETGVWPTDRRFTGQRWEASLGLYDYRARFYDPTLGRFLQPDPLVPEPGNPQALNRYAYVYNNPLCYTDPSGHWLETAWDILNIAWDIYEVRRDPSLLNIGALVVDVGAAVLPFVPAGVGMVVRGGKAAKAGIELATHVDEAADVGRIVAEAASRADEAADALKAVENVIEITNPLPRTQRFARVLPERVARDIEAGLKDVYLGKPGDPDVFITAAEDLARYRTQASVERRLALPSSNERRAVVTFKYDVEAGGIASPVFRNYPGFVGKGRTLGGAREWVIPNRPLREMPIWDIKVRYLR
jgi:RHS repeat-associated protein